VHNNTSATAQIVKEGDSANLVDMANLLGPNLNFPRSGVIRPGVMILKKSCSADDSKKYESLVEKGASWDDIDKELGKDGNGRSKLVPKNVDYFTVRAADCTNPENVEKIYKLYADEDGKLRSFPVVFPVNEWWNIIPHSLRCFGTSGIKYRSDFKPLRNEQGEVVDVERICTYPTAIEPGKRVFGGRGWGERPCDPEACEAYQKGECSFGGSVQFLIPGIPGMGVWVLPTTSWYSLHGIKNSLHLLSNITGGRISGMMGKPPLGVFTLRKKKDNVSRIDPKDGKAVRAEQFIITLDADVDLTTIGMSHEGGKVIDMGKRAMSLIAGDAPSDTEPDKEPPLPPAAATEKASPETVTSPSPEVGENKGAPPKAADAGKNNGDNGKRELKPSANVLWESLKKLHEDPAKIKVALKRLTKKESFFDLTEDEANKGIEALTEQELNSFE